MQIRHTELTPNPDTLKFVFLGQLSVEGSHQFADAGSAAVDPLAHALFALGGVHSVFYTPDFVTVTKTPEAEWEGLVDRIKGTVTAEADKVAGTSAKATTVAAGEAEDDLLTKIRDILDNRVRPALAGDGGGLEVLGLDGFTLTIRYQGACGSCPSATSGTLRGIEHLLQMDVDPRLMVIPG